MNTEYLQNFLLVVEVGSVAEAARRLGLTPAAVAHHLRVLEQDVGVSLVKRAGRRVLPTEAGYRVLESARGILGQVTSLKSAARGDEPVGELRLGVIQTALHNWLPAALSALVQKYPLLRISLHAGTSISLLEKVQMGECDVALCIIPEFSLSKSLNVEILNEEELIVLAHESLENHSAHELLSTQPFIRYDPTQWGGRIADRYLRAQGLVPHERFKLVSLTAIALMVDQNLGVSLIPNVSSTQLNGGGLRVQRVALPHPWNKRTIGAIWPKAATQTGVVRALVDVLKQRVNY